MSQKYTLFKVFTGLIGSPDTIAAKFTQFNAWLADAEVLLPGVSPTLNEAQEALVAIVAMTRTTYAPVYNAISNAGTGLSVNGVIAFLLDDTATLVDNVALLEDYFVTEVSFATPGLVEAFAAAEDPLCVPCEKKTKAEAFAEKRAKVNAENYPQPVSEMPTAE